MQGNFYGNEFTGVEIDENTIDLLKQSFLTYATISNQRYNNKQKMGDFINVAKDDQTLKEGLLDPKVMECEYLKLGIDKSSPSLYSMITWIVKENHN